MTPFVLALASLIIVGGQNLSTWKKSMLQKLTHFWPELQKANCTSAFALIFFSRCKHLQKNQIWNYTAWYDLSKRCLPNKSQARLQDRSYSSGYHGMWLVSNLSLKRGPIGWASYLFWAWCPRHIVLSNIQVLTASCSNMGDLPNFANTILKFVCSSLDQHIFAISWPCEGDHVWSCHIMSIHLGCDHLGIFIHCPQQETLVSTVSSADKLHAGHCHAGVEEKACLAFTNRWQ